MNFSSEIVLTPDNAFGALQPDGTWNGILGMVERGLANVSLGSLSVTSQRKRSFEYLTPFTDES